MSEMFTPHGYQVKAEAFVADVPKCAIWLSMGLGKSVTALTAIGKMLDRFEVGRVLIVAPLRVATGTWPNEIAKWQHTRHFDYALATGPVRQRQAALARDADITVINRENFVWLTEQYKREDWPFDTVIWDESSGLKNPSAKRTRAAKHIACSLPRYKMGTDGQGRRKRIPIAPEPAMVDRFIQLTGTPTSTGLLDLWSQIFILDEGKRLGRTFEQYKLRWFVQTDRDGYKWEPRKGAKDEIFAALKDIAISMSAEDYLDLPPFQTINVPVKLSDAARKSYRQMEKDFITQIDDETITAFNAAAKTGKLMQCANGAVYHGENGEWVDLHNAKLDALEDILEAAQGEPVLVAYNFKSDLARLLKRFPQAIALDKSPATVDRWNSGKIPLLLAHPASAGHGLNLQAGGRIAVWFGLNWSLELFQQFNKRLDRQGQTKPGRIYLTGLCS